MRILFVTGRELEYPRNKLLFKLLEQRHQVDFIGRKAGKKSILLQSVFNSIRSTPAFITGKYSIYFAGFYGHLYMLWAGLFAKRPIIFDAFLSTFDTICLDRGIFPPHSLVGKLAKWIDQRACALAKRVIVDTNAQATFFHLILGIPMEKIDVLPVGCDEEIFFPQESLNSGNNLVLFYGSLLPLHNIDMIIKAAEIMNKENVQFQMIGPFNKTGRSLSKSGAYPSNITFISPVPLNDLPRYISGATICLGGHFGASEKASRVIAGKTYQCIAMGKPTIVGDNSANKELLTHGYDAWFCRMNDAQALADSILYLLNNDELRQSLGRNALSTYETKVSNRVLSDKLEQIIKRAHN